MTFSKQICLISELHFIFMNMHSAVIVMVPIAASDKHLKSGLVMPSNATS